MVYKEGRNPANAVAGLKDIFHHTAEPGLKTHFTLTAAAGLIRIFQNKDVIGFVGELKYYFTFVIYYYLNLIKK